MTVIPTMAEGFEEIEPVFVRIGGAFSVVEPEPVFSWMLDVQMPQTLPVGDWDNIGFSLHTGSLEGSAPAQRLQVDVALIFPKVCLYQGERIPMIRVVRFYLPVQAYPSLCWKQTGR